MPIGEIHQHDAIWSYNETSNSSQVTNVNESIREEHCGAFLMELSFSTGEIVVCGDDQEMLLYDYGWIPAYALQPNDTVLYSVSEETIRIEDIEYYSEITDEEHNILLSFSTSYYVGKLSVLALTSAKNTRNSAEIINKDEFYIFE